MVSIYDLKPKFQKLLRPLTQWLAQSGVTANQVTIGAMVLSIVTGGIVALNIQSSLMLLLMPAVLFVRMALNAIDGMLAREHGMKTPLGNILNELGDVVSDAALYLPFVLWGGMDGILIVAIVLLSILSEFVGVLGVVIGASRRYDGPVGKSDRAFLFGAISLLLAFGVKLGIALTVLLGLMILGLIITVFNRIHHALREVK